MFSDTIRYFRPSDFPQRLRRRLILTSFIYLATLTKVHGQGQRAASSGGCEWRAGGIRLQAALCNSECFRGVLTALLHASAQRELMAKERLRGHEDKSVSLRFTCNKKPFNIQLKWFPRIWPLLTTSADLSCMNMHHWLLAAMTPVLWDNHSVNLKIKPLFSPPGFWWLNSSHSVISPSFSLDPPAGRQDFQKQSW